MKVYFKALKLHFKSLLEYKASFITSFLSQILVFFSYYFIIISLFTKFDNIKGFTLYEVLLCFSVIQFGYAFCESFGRGLDKFDNLIIKGEFDRILLRPKNIIIQTLCYDSDYTKISRLLQSVIVLIIAIINLKLTWTPLKILTIILMIISAILIFFSIFLLAAAYCFLTIQGLEVRNVFTAGGKHMAQYPIGVFKKGFVWFFTFIIPYAFVNYYPLLYILDKNKNPIYSLSPLIVIIYLIPCLLIFYKGMKRYTSSG